MGVEWYEYCDGEDNPADFKTWEECVEWGVHNECDEFGIDVSGWHLYNGTPIQKDEE